MTNMVPTYIAGQWYTAPDEGVPLVDASTGEAVAQVSSTGIDLDRLVAHAREAGGPALRALTFTGRALLLKRLAAHLADAATDAYHGYGPFGVGEADARADLDAGIGVLSAYASLGLKELPNDTIYVAGSPQKLGKNLRAQTIYTSRPGLVLAINAFDLPAWGLLEKLAPAILAGAPVIVKPATSNAPVVAVIVRTIIDSAILPDGALQLVCGEVSGLMDRLSGQDHIAFTGSAGVAALLRSHPAVVQRGARLNAATESVNATVLGTDIAPGTPGFDAFVTGVFREMTANTGQKCTAIRRVLVPAATLDDFIAALRGRLETVVIGDPRVEGTTMGPLVNTDQVQKVRGAVNQLIADGAKVIVGEPDGGATVASGDPQHGAFFAPTVLVATDVHHPALHQTEAFGPVVTIFPFADLAEAIELVGLGQGSLVTSLVSDDDAVVREVVTGIAPFHGRILVIDSVNAATAPPHGTIFPQLIHGGPGRAGGGMELGGLHGVLDLMQATSVAGSPPMLVGLTKTWNNGAPTVASDVHPFRKYLDELELGETLFTGSREITLDDIEHFAHFTGDTFYAHMDEEAAKASPLFKGRVAHGYFIIAAAAGLFVDPEPGPVLANFGLEHLRFVQPVYPGDLIKLRLTAKHKAERPGAGWGEVTWDVEVTNQRDEVVATYDLLTINAVHA